MLPSMEDIDERQAKLNEENPSTGETTEDGNQAAAAQSETPSEQT